jgi:MFS family permease
MDIKEKKFFGFSKNVFVLGLVSLLMDISSEMIYPLVPIFLSTTLGASKSIIGLIEGIAESTASILKVISGWLSDRVGKRKFLIFSGYGLSTFSRPILALASSWSNVLVYRFVDRTGKGIRTAPRDAVIAESTDPNFLGRAFGFHRAMDTMGAVAGPSLAFFLLSLFLGDFRKVFWVSMIPGALAVFLIIAFVKEKARKMPESRLKTPDSRKSEIRNPKSEIKLSLKGFDSRFKFFLLSAGIFSLGNSSDAFLVLRAQDLGIAITLIPLVYLTFNLVYSILSTPIGILSDKIGKRKVILLSYGLFALVYLGFALASRPEHTWGLFVLYGIFMAMTEGVQRAFVAELIPGERKATGFGIYHTLIGLTTLPASIVGGMLWQKIGAPATFIYGTIMATVAGIFFFFLLKDDSRDERPFPL